MRLKTKFTLDFDLDTFVPDEEIDEKIRLNVANMPEKIRNEFLTGIMKDVQNFMGIPDDDPELLLTETIESFELIDDAN